MKNEHIARSFGTHDGSFHADEVTACSLLLRHQLIDRDQVVRTRDMIRLSQCEYVCDVGGEYDATKKRFDHHQAHYSGNLSSAGMILLYLESERIIDKGLYDYLNQTLIMGVDAHDTGYAPIIVGTSTFSQVIGNFLPITYEASSHEMNAAFWLAVDFVVGYLDRLEQRFQYILRCREWVRAEMAKKQKVLIFDTPIPWMDNFFEMDGEKHPAEFVIMPAGDHWKLRGIPPSLAERMKVRYLLPAKWAGLHDVDLQKVSSIPGAIFCHKGRFISIWKTKEDALLALQSVLMKESK